MGAIETADVHPMTMLLDMMRERFLSAAPGMDAVLETRATIWTRCFPRPGASGMRRDHSQDREAGSAAAVRGLGR
jgi:hypothetical protein